MDASHRTLRRRWRLRGITLVELLVALFVFSIVAMLAGSGIVQALRVQSLNEANTSLQGKLRRVTEVVSQDLRSTVLGVVVNTPYTSNAGQVSFTLATGGQGYEVRTISGNAWPGANVFRVFADAQPVSAGDRVLLVNGAGLGSTAPVASVAALSNNRYDVTLGGGCTAAINATNPVRMFVVDAVGYRLLADGDLVRQTAGSDPEPLAFALSAFELQYGYRHQDGTLTMLDAPRTNASGTPLRVAANETLESLRVRVAAEETIFGNRTVERAYVAQIALPPPGTVNLRSVVSCP